MRDQVKTGNSAVARRNILFGSTTLAATAALGSVAPMQVAQAQQPTPEPGTPGGRKPNILFIMGDDIGWFNVSAYNMGIMGYRTPNIDRIGREGASSPTGMASRAAPPVALRSLPASRRSAPVSPRSAYLARSSGFSRDPSVADVMKSHGYATGQFGKNHLGDRNEHLPTVMASTSSSATFIISTPRKSRRTRLSERSQIPPAVRAARRLSHTYATDTADPTVDPHSARSASRKSRTPARSTTKRMETIDDEFPDAAKDFIETASRKPTSRGSAISTRPGCTSLPISRKASQGKTVSAFIPTVWSSTDGHVGELLKLSTTSASPTTPS